MNMKLLLVVTPPSIYQHRTLYFYFLLTNSDTNDLPGDGRPTELPGGGMPGPSGDEDGNAGALTALSCPQHRGHSGGGKPSPPIVHLMRHSSPPTGAER